MDWFKAGHFRGRHQGVLVALENPLKAQKHGLGYRVAICTGRRQKVRADVLNALPVAGRLARVTRGPDSGAAGWRAPEQALWTSGGGTPAAIGQPATSAARGTTAAVLAWLLIHLRDLLDLSSPLARPTCRWSGLSQGR